MTSPNSSNRREFAESLRQYARETLDLAVTKSEGLSKLAEDIEQSRLSFAINPQLLFPELGESSEEPTSISALGTVLLNPLPESPISSLEGTTVDASSFVDVSPLSITIIIVQLIINPEYYNYVRRTLYNSD